MKTLTGIVSAGLLSALLLASTAEARTRVYVKIGPPPIVVEHRTAAPGRNYAWQEGHHRWTGDRYEWVAGSWVRPPRAHARWVAGHWAHDRHGNYFVEGHWARR
jgi:hypothetical protein